MPTILQGTFSGEEASTPPLIMDFVNHMIFWPLPMWAFTALYGALLAYVVALLKLVPVERKRRTAT